MLREMKFEKMVFELHNAAARDAEGVEVLATLVFQKGYPTRRLCRGKAMTNGRL